MSRIPVPSSNSLEINLISEKSLIKGSPKSKFIFIDNVFLKFSQKTIFIRKFSLILSSIWFQFSRETPKSQIPLN